MSEVHLANPQLLKFQKFDRCAHFQSTKEIGLLYLQPFGIQVFPTLHLPHDQLLTHHDDARAIFLISMASRRA
jgi:hypothetical protein